MKKLLSIAILAIAIAGISAAAYTNDIILDQGDGYQPIMPLIDDTLIGDDTFEESVDLDAATAAKNEILAMNDPNILDVRLDETTGEVFITVVDEYAPEYAERFVMFGIGYSVWVLDEAGEHVPVGIMPIDIQPRLPGGENGRAGMNRSMTWMLPLFAILVLAAGAVIIFQRNAQRTAAMQTNTGDVITGSERVSRAETIAAVQDSAVTPDDGVFTAIKENIET